MSNLIGSLTLVEIECADCITHFAMDASLQKRARETGRTFYCPNGHGNWYQDNELARLRKEQQNLKNRTSYAEMEAKRAQADLEDVKKEKANIKRQLTITRKRIANGVCPQCHRTFKQLNAHMHNKHPEFVEVHNG